MDEYSRLEQLNNLRQSGAITEEEFQREKQKILASTNNFNQSKNSNQSVNINLDNKQYTMLIHLSQFASLVVPLAGLAAPIIMWQMKKDQPDIDQHGRVVANWMISAFIYGVISFILVFVIVGIFLLIALGICSIVFTIIGAVKANNGELWNYPLSIKFFDVNPSAVGKTTNSNGDILDV